MTDNSVLVVDAGSSSIRCLMVDVSSRVVRSVSRPWRYRDDSGAGDLARSFDLEGCWQSMCDAIRECVRCGAEPYALAITSQRQSLVFIDEVGDPIYAGPNTDLRSVFQGAAVDSTHARMIYSTTGHAPSFMMAAGKLGWFRDVRPNDYRNLSQVLTLADWLAYRLTGRLACEPTLAAASGLVDIRERAWASEMFEALGLICPENELCEAINPRGSVNTVDAGAIAGIPVVVAGADTQCALIGSGAIHEGQTAVVAGWSATVQLLVDRPVLSPSMKTWTELFQIPGLWIVESSAGDVGNAWQWLTHTLFDDEISYRQMDEMAAASTDGADGVAVYLGPQAMDVSAVGMKLGGILFPTPLALGGPTRGQLSRAALESFCYAIRANLEQAERESGVAATTISLCGGMIRSKTFQRIMPHILGRPLTVRPEHETTAIGAALVGRTAIGEFDSLYEAAQTQACRANITEPDTQTAAEYQERYTQWLELQGSVGGLLK